MEEKIKKALQDRQEIVFAYLFGSYAQGREGPLSDLDIAVYTENPKEGKYGYKAELITELIKDIQVDVDLTILNKAPNFLAFQVLKNGKLLFCKNDSFRQNFHYRVVRDYLDFKPIMVQQNKVLVERIKNGSFGGGKDR